MEKEPIDYIREHISNLSCFEEYYKLYDNIKKAPIKEQKYNIGDDVILEKGTLLHGIKSFNNERIEGIKKYGFIFGEYHGVEVQQQKYCVCFWNMNKRISLKDYINEYSSETIHLKNRFTRKYSQIYIPFDYDVKDRQNLFKSINKFVYSIDFVRDSKENQFLPSLNKQDDFIGFILNNSVYDEIKKYDIYNGCISLNDLKRFLPEWVINKTVLNKIPTQTDHEIAIIFGLPTSIVEGILVGKIIENDKIKLNYLKENFPNCYICNLVGKVIL